MPGLPPFPPPPRLLDPLKVSGVLILPVGPNSGRTGGGSPARTVEAVGEPGWGCRFPAALPPGCPGELARAGECAVELAFQIAKSAW